MGGGGDGGRVKTLLLGIGGGIGIVPLGIVGVFFEDWLTAFACCCFIFSSFIRFIAADAPYCCKSAAVGSPFVGVKCLFYYQIIFLYLKHY